MALSNNLQSNKQRHTDIKITGPAEHFKIKRGQPYLVGNKLPSPDLKRVIVLIYKVKRGEAPTVPICSVGHVSYWGRSVVGCQRVMGRPCVSSTLSVLLTTISRAFCNRIENISQIFAIYRISTNRVGNQFDYIFLFNYFYIRGRSQTTFTRGGG